ncbi:MAG: ZIP family metal transporter [Oscillospiraceae bacterium]|nr:ZIP family metal transporter [Oscillospiraceae bacterium]
MWYAIARGVLIPFFGTSAGAACVFFLRRAVDPRLEKGLAGFAAGIMVSASFFSLLRPALEYSAPLGRLAFLPATAGFLAGIAFLPVLDALTPRLRPESGRVGCGLDRTGRLILAVTLHNLPEGVAVGVAYAGWFYGTAEVSLAGASALAVGVALQNFPEGAIVSLPLRAEGMGRWKAFLWGVLSGAVEPAGAVVTVFAAGFFLPLLPYLLSFAAGAMFFVTVEELIPAMSAPPRSRLGPAAFALGFSLMMALDVGLG